MSNKKNQPKIGIAIPTYNEAANIGRLLRAIRAYAVKNNVQITVLVIDGHSTDRTSSVVKQIAKKYNSDNLTFSINILEQRNKNGLHNAYIEGFDRLLRHNPDFVLQMDADLSHDPEYIGSFVSACKQHDLIVGSRYIKGGGTPGWSIRRKILSSFGNLYASRILSPQLTDYTGGFNMYSARLLKAVNPSSIHSKGYGFLIELKYRALLESQSAHQIPIIFRERSSGKSKLPFMTGMNNLLIIPYIRVTYKTKLKNQTQTNL